MAPEVDNALLSASEPSIRASNPSVPRRRSTLRPLRSPVAGRRWTYDPSYSRALIEDKTCKPRYIDKKKMTLDGDVIGRLQSQSWVSSNGTAAGRVLGPLIISASDSPIPLPPLQDQFYSVSPRPGRATDLRLDVGRPLPHDLDGDESVMPDVECFSKWRTVGCHWRCAMPLCR